MFKAYALAGLAAVLPGCATPAAAWKGRVEWPNEYSGKKLVPFMEAGAALAAAAAIRELVRQSLATDPGLFWGCSSPEQGLDVAVYGGPTPGLYYVMLEERFDRCGGPRYRVLDWWHVYAVTPQGEVVAEAPPPAEDAFIPPVAPSSPPSPPEQAPPPAAPAPSTGADTPAPSPSLAPAPMPAPAPEASPPAEPSPAPPSAPPAPSIPEPDSTRPKALEGVPTTRSVLPSNSIALNPPEVGQGLGPSVRIA